MKIMVKYVDFEFKEFSRNDSEIEVRSLVERGGYFFHFTIKKNETTENIKNNISYIFYERIKIDGMQNYLNIKIKEGIFNCTLTNRGGGYWSCDDIKNTIVW